MKKSYDISFANLKKEGWAWLESILGIIPGMTGSLLRGWFYGIFFDGFRGRHTRIGIFSHIWFPWNMAVGRHVYFGRNVYINTIHPGDLTIGRNVMIGPYVMIITSNHNTAHRTRPMQLQGLSSKPVVIEDDVWIGGNSIVLPGVRVGRGSIISAAAVVTKDTPPFSISGGNPAVVLKYRSGGN